MPMNILPACILLAAAGLAACVAASPSPQPPAGAAASADAATDASGAAAPAASGEAVDGLNVVAFDLVRAGDVTAAHLEHVEARTWRVTFPGLNARTALVGGRSPCCVTFSDFDFLGISSLDVTGPDIGGEDPVGVRATNLVGPERRAPAPG